MGVVNLRCSAPAERVSGYISHSRSFELPQPIQELSAGFADNYARMAHNGKRWMTRHRMGANSRHAACAADSHLGLRIRDHSNLGKTQLKRFTCRNLYDWNGDRPHPPPPSATVLLCHCASLQSL